MTKFSDNRRAVAVPNHRMTRAARLFGVAGQVVGSAAFNGAAAYAKGQRPQWQSLILTPKNITRLTNQLAQMRGAAMKLGQLLSMDNGDFLPPEVTAILGRLRAEADFMPPKQLRNVLNDAWGDGWRRSFSRFDVRPMAAASIGQVHYAVLNDGREVAIKVQYPGVARSIDSDVANVATILRTARLLPSGFDLSPYLEETKRQLHEETDYLREGAFLADFGALLADNPAFHVPIYHAEWSTDKVLTMSFERGVALDACEDLPQADRDLIATNLFELLVREVADLHRVQTDPNFANYLYDPESKRITLLDFGATRVLPDALVARFDRFLTAGLTSDEFSMQSSIREFGLVDEKTTIHQRTLLKELIDAVFTSLRHGDLDRFEATDTLRRFQNMGFALANTGYIPPAAPMDAAFVYRKTIGLTLLASRLRSNLPTYQMISDNFPIRENVES